MRRCRDRRYVGSAEHVADVAEGLDGFLAHVHGVLVGSRWQAPQRIIVERILDRVFPTVDTIYVGLRLFHIGAISGLRVQVLAAFTGAFLHLAQQHLALWLGVDQGRLIDEK